MTDLAITPAPDVDPLPQLDTAGLLIINLPDLSDFPDEVRQAHADYEAACECWSDADADLDTIEGRIANVDNQDALRIQSAAKAGEDLTTVELVDRSQLDAQRHKAELIRRTYGGQLRAARNRLVRALQAHKADHLARTRAVATEAAEAYTEALRALRRARATYHRAVATHAWFEDVDLYTWETFTGRVPTSRVAAFDRTLSAADAEAGRLLSAHLTTEGANS